MEKKVEFLWLEGRETETLSLPAYETEGAAGMDVAACLDADCTIEPGDIVLIPTGFALAIPTGYEIQVRPRSGLAIKHGLTVVNAPGTIDADYRGEVGVGLINLGRQAVTIHHGDRIAQLVLAPVLQARWTVVTELEATERGAGGFGHTGV
ncbi:dUTP diphosphatase [Desulfotalea psychrophila]|uniref:Deoxyuridine 5'-triphosphate nucleotidohydrolase n=1 Tax=Desulfotalea psychrophila (strain LSv54 / DSM 12343) TaxID=177439 RepID=DUT_DESPS|nr:dUTP diphosphatase [Desulfotalea psychrophila]Q6AJZ0.1 RecName: Full=Deoxyuridine 5'-triphosphate nucleotidohydrolase; Short=dUTPase; AltName: Full=dUTP pyrophosphatase [Desulfotalea psychrophila LSv54]CAG37336.1 probable deoxyuridine 5'-triphosphate nucleotidohydrolase [Desulfotalea psychrophila LSv54]